MARNILDVPVRKKKKKRKGLLAKLYHLYLFYGKPEKFRVKIIWFVLEKWLCHSHAIRKLLPLSCALPPQQVLGRSLPAPPEDKRLILPGNILGWSCRFLRTYHLQWEPCLLSTDSSKQGCQDLAHSKFSLEMVPTKSLSHGNRTFLATQSLGCLSLMFPSGDRLKARSLWASSQQTQHGYVAPQELLPG